MRPLPTADREELTALAALAERICRARTRRSEAFSELEAMFSEPAWDMLLDLFVATVRTKRVPVSSACIAAGASNTTGLRWIMRLERSGAIVRVADPADARRSFVELQPATFAALVAWLRYAHAQFRL